MNPEKDEQDERDTFSLNILVAQIHKLNRNRNYLCMFNTETNSGLFDTLKNLCSEKKARDSERKEVNKKMICSSSTYDTHTRNNAKPKPILDRNKKKILRDIERKRE